MPAGIQDSLRQRGVRMTRQRLLLLGLIDSSGLHLDAESLYQMAKEKDAKAIWNTMNELVEAREGRPGLDFRAVSVVAAGR
jgi:Fe2+ or Zn2+ uptake regulation protein